MHISDFLIGACTGFLIGAWVVRVHMLKWLTQMNQTYRDATEQLKHHYEGMVKEFVAKALKEKGYSDS